jgi:hypothetical protein
MAASLYGLIARFDTAPEIYHAAEKVRDAGYKNWDCITPFPVHGLDGAMGVRRSHVPKFSLLGGITGFATGMSMIWFTGSFDYPLVVGGKPYFSPLFAFPVSYELTILFTAFATIAGMFILNWLPQHYHLVRGLDDTFYVVIEARDPKFDLARAKALLTSAGAREISELEA